MLFYPLYYDIISLTSLKIIQAFHLSLGFAENSIVSWYFKIQYSVRITKGSDNGDSDNRSSIVYHIVSCIPIVAILYAFMLHVLVLYVVTLCALAWKTALLNARFQTNQIRVKSNQSCVGCYCLLIT